MMFFFARCGHCKNLAPEWETAARELKGQVKLGAVDATAHGSLAQQYGVKGYPTIKQFSAGPKGQPVDYNGPREAAGIVEHALQTLDAAGVTQPAVQLVDTDSFTAACGQHGKVCVLLFVPHLLDSSAAARNGYLATLADIAKGFRGKPLHFAWVEGTTQENLEKALNINFVYPTLALLSAERKVYAVQRMSWSAKNAKAFINGVLSGR